jgi:hypothetical protein
VGAAITGVTRGKSPTASTIHHERDPSGLKLGMAHLYEKPLYVRMG